MPLITSPAPNLKVNYEGRVRESHREVVCETYRLPLGIGVEDLPVVELADVSHLQLITGLRHGSCSNFGIYYLESPRKLDALRLLLFLLLLLLLLLLDLRLFLTVPALLTLLCIRPRRNGCAILGLHLLVLFLLGLGGLGSIGVHGVRFAGPFSGFGLCFLLIVDIFEPAMTYR